MATAYQNAVTRRDAVLAELASGTFGPDVSDQARSIGWVAYRNSLLEELKTLNEMIVQLAGPFFEVNRMRA